MIQIGMCVLVPMGPDDMSGWAPMGLYGFLGVHMGPYGSVWHVRLDPYGSPRPLWVPMDPCWSLRHVGLGPSGAEQTSIPLAWYSSTGAARGQVPAVAVLLHFAICLESLVWGRSPGLLGNWSREVQKFKNWLHERHFLGKLAF